MGTLTRHVSIHPIGNEERERASWVCYIRVALLRLNTTLIFTAVARLVLYNFAVVLCNVCIMQNSVGIIWFDKYV